MDMVHATAARESAGKARFGAVAVDVGWAKTSVVVVEVLASLELRGAVRMGRT